MIARMVLALLLTTGIAAAGEVDFATRLDEYMAARAVEGFSGVVYVARGEQLYARGFGPANREAGTPWTPSTVFDIGSLTKQFTAAAILKLEMEGKLKVTDPMSTYLAGVPQDKADITLHQLLTHSAGFVDSLGEDYESVTRDEFVKLALSSTLQSAPGESYSYSNVGYSLLGAIIENITGTSYEQYLHDHVLKPAGMQETGYVLPGWKPEALAVGYNKDGREWGTPLDKAWAEDGPYWHLRANGGLLSTAEDLHRWNQALAGEAVLSSAAKQKYFGPHIAEDEDSFYGYGWVIGKTRSGRKVHWHDGGNGIFFAVMVHYVEDDTLLVLASNQADRSAAKELVKINGLLFPD